MGAHLHGVVDAAASRRDVHVAAILVALVWFVYTLYNTILLQEPPRLWGPFSVLNMLYIPLTIITVAQGLRALRGLWQQSWLYGYIAFFGWALLSLAWYDPATTADVAQRSVIYALLPLVAIPLHGSSRLPVFIAIVASALAVAAWTIVHAIRSGFAYRGGVPVNANFLSVLVGLGALVLLVVYVTQNSSRVGQWLGLASLVTSIYALLILGSRGVTVAFLAALCALVALNWERRRRVLHVLVAAVVVAGVGQPRVVNGVASAIETISMRIASVADNIERGAQPSSPSRGVAGSGAPSTPPVLRDRLDTAIARLGEGDLSTLNLRLGLWKAGLAYSTGSWRNLVVGGGMGFSNIVVLEASGLFDSIHNLYLQLLVDYGLVGISAFLVFHLILMLKLWRRGGPEAQLGLAGTVFLLVAGLTSDIANLHVYWIFVGLAAAVALSPCGLGKTVVEGHDGVT